MTRDQLTGQALILAAIFLPLLALAIAEVRAAWRQTRRANLAAVIDGEIDAAMKRHPAGKGRRDQSDPVRVEQMAAIAEAEAAWDEDVWGRG